MHCTHKVTRSACWSTLEAVERTNASHLKLGPLTANMDAALASMASDGVIERLWRGDHTLWSDDPTEITQPNRLGWLEVIDSIAPETASLKQFAAEVAAEGYRRLVLMGMGGSSLAPEVMQRTFGVATGMLHLSVLDTTNPDSVLSLARELDLERTLFLVASKSGSTIETLSHFEYFWSLAPQGRHFIAVTDEGSLLQKLGAERGFRRVFVNRPDIGGRYSALSYFGLVPAALIGADIDEMLSMARLVAEECRVTDPRANPHACLGAAMGEAALVGRDKLTLFLPNELSSFGDWAEQLLAESTGKAGKGIIPIVGEPAGPPSSYGSDRLFVAIGAHADVSGLEAAGHPVVQLPYAGKQQLGAEFFRWQFATAVVASVLAINPFDQPDVQSAKDATARALAAPTAEGVPNDGLGELAALLKEGDYIAIQAHLAGTPANDAALAELRLRLRDRYRLATTVGYGPRFLHSTGQLHKGGPNSGVFIQLVGDNRADLTIPGQPYKFGRLKRAQADGDLEALRSRGRRVLRLRLGTDAESAIAGLAASVV